MSDEADGRPKRLFGYPRRTVLLEAVRISYVLGITGAVTMLVAISFYWLEPGILEGAEPVSSGLLLVMFPVALALGLYLYDRRHDRDLIIADAALRGVRPVAALIRLLRGGGP